MSYSRAVEPMHPPPVVHQAGPRASSLYSQPSPETPPPQYSSRMPSAIYADVTISPPDSPRESAERYRQENPDVSPIEEEHPAFRFPLKEGAYKSLLPVLRKHAPRTTYADEKEEQNTGWRRPRSYMNETDALPTRWDDYSGEPTGGEAGKEATFIPGQHHPAKTSHPHDPNTAQVLSEKHAKQGRKRKSIEKKPPPLDLDPLDHPAYREPWRGASGRTKLVEPVRNDRSKRLDHELQYPNEPARDVSIPTTSTAGAMTARAVAALAAAAAAPIKPTTPLKLGTSNPKVRSPTNSRMPSSTPNQQSTFTPACSTTVPLTKLTQDQKENLTPDSPTIPPAVLAPSRSMTPPDSSLAEESQRAADEQHGSRFSWTTYATATVTDSPPSTPQPDHNAPPVPIIPTDPSPLMTRKRPVAAHTEPAPRLSSKIGNVARKPVGVEKRASSMYSQPSRSGNTLVVQVEKSPSLLDKGKSLPQPPPELEATDRISTMEAQLDNLRVRKRNINRIVKDLEAVSNSTSINYDRAAREQAKKKAASLNTEMAQVTQEEHDIGLRLHRSQRKRDAEDAYEKPTGLWIKRVTS